MKKVVLAAAMASFAGPAFAEPISIVDQACYSRKLAVCVASADAALAPRPVDQNCRVDWKEEIEFGIGASTSRCVPTRETISATYHVCEVRTMASISAGENCLRTIDIDASIGGRLDSLSNVLRQEFVSGLKVIFDQMREDVGAPEPPAQP